MSTYYRYLLLLLLLTWPCATLRAEVLVRWDLDQVPSRESLGISALLIPVSKPAVVQQAVAQGYRVYLYGDAASLSEAATLAKSVSGVVVRGDASGQQLDQLRRRLRSPGVRVLSVDERGTWPRVRLNSVTMRDDVLQVSSRTAQPWVDSNAFLVRIAAASRDDKPLLLSYAWEPITVADTHQGPALEDYLVAIAEAGSFGSDLVLPLHEGFQRSLLLGKPAARAEWQQIRRYLDFYSWDLPRRYRRISNIGVVTADPMNWVEVLRLLTRHNLPFEVLPPDRLQGGNLEGFALTIVLDPLKEAQIQQLSAFARKGGTVVLNGPAQGFKWEDAAPLVKNDHQTGYRVGEGRVLQLVDAIGDPDEFAKEMREVLGPDGRVVDVWNGITVLIAPYQDPMGDTVLVTALNYAHEAQPIQLRVRGAFSLVYYESPESEPALLPFRQRDGHTEFVLPDLRIGGRVFLSHEDAPK